MMWRSAVRGLLLFAVLTGTTDGADAPLETVRPFLERHCVECHGEKTQKNDKRFDTLGVDLSDRNTLESWQEILDQLNLGEMPPDNRPQPDTAEVARVTDTLTLQLKHAYARQRSTGADTVIRRLNRLELRNTLRDLLYLQGAAYRPGGVTGLVDNNGNGRVERKGSDPVRAFPEDEEEHGFTNIGGRLVMSDFLLKLTMAAAQETLAAATHTELKPSTEPHRFDGELVPGDQYGRQLLEIVSHEMHPDYEIIVQRYQRFGRLSPYALRSGVRTSARYRITIEASGHNQQHPWGELLNNDQSEPFILGLHIADTANGGISGPTSTHLTDWTLPGDGSRHTFSFETWIDDTWTPWLGWENGPYDRGFRAERLVEKYLPEQFTPRPDRKAVTKEVYDAWPREMAATVLRSGYKGPHVRIHSMTIEPLVESWPPKSHVALYGDGPAYDADIELLLHEFAERAWRRPVTADEVAPYVALVRRISDPPKAAPDVAIRDLNYKVYKGKWSRLPKFDELESFAAADLSNGLIDIRVANSPDYFGALFQGVLRAPADGEYEFQMASDDGARISIDGKPVVEHDGLHGASLRKGKSKLKAGDHQIRVEYFAYGAPNSFTASWSGPGFREAPLSVRRESPKPMAVSLREARAIKALQAGYTALLCSPKFLYLRESSGQLSDYEIASRLSYFLWSSMPDERLLSLAAQGRLTEPDVLRSETERMLSDWKSAAFKRNFTVAWLRLDRLGKMPPEKSGPFRFYHDRKVEPMMVEQTTAFFADVLDNNRDISHFIDSDYTFMNETLAEWIYQRKGVGGSRMQKVALNDPRRGGILTQPSVMTATANGVDTSPVVRGVWVLESILGTPPSPPPPDVEPLPTDLRGAKTIREQLERHRVHEACNGCHRRIDPMGFAMENFDPVGRWRDKYPIRPQIPVDPSATLANGQQIDDIVAFKTMLMSRQHDLARSLTEKLLTYASGRMPEPTDRGEVNRIVSELDANGNGLRDLVHLVVQSEMFLTK